MLALAPAALSLPLLCAGAPIRAAAAIPQNLRFRTMYHDAQVGSHRITFRSDGDRLTVATHIDITIKVLFFTAFRYLHDAVEVWQFGRLLSVVSTTEDNGLRLKVSGYATNDGFRIIGADGPYLAPAHLLTSNSLWNPRLMREGRVIDVQHGGEIGLVVKPFGEEIVETPQGPVLARRYQIITPNNAGSLFFDADGRWVKGLMEQRGEHLEYVLES